MLSAFSILVKLFLLSTQIQSPSSFHDCCFPVDYSFQLLDKEVIDSTVLATDIFFFIIYLFNIMYVQSAIYFGHFAVRRVCTSADPEFSRSYAYMLFTTPLSCDTHSNLTLIIMLITCLIFLGLTFAWSKLLAHIALPPMYRNCTKFHINWINIKFICFFKKLIILLCIMTHVLFHSNWCQSWAIATGRDVIWAVLIEQWYRPHIKWSGYRSVLFDG